MSSFLTLLVLGQRGQLGEWFVDVVGPRVDLAAAVPVDPATRPRFVPDAELGRQQPLVGAELLEVRSASAAWALWLTGEMPALCVDSPLHQASTYLPSLISTCPCVPST